MLARRSLLSPFRRLCTTLASEPVASSSTSAIQRHGAGDKVVNLNVGGKSFITLRSTLAESPTLREYVERAEANLEFSKDGATFIDRDPTHFPIVLAHMRNKCEGLGLSLTLGATRHKTTVSLPKDHATLGELLLEAKHYQLPELEKRICKRYFVTSLISQLGVGNPFEAFARGATALRGVLLAVVGGSGIAVSMTDDSGSRSSSSDDVLSAVKERAQAAVDRFVRGGGDGAEGGGERR